MLLVRVLLETLSMHEPSSFQATAVRVFSAPLQFGMHRDPSDWPARNHRIRRFVLPPQRADRDLLVPRSHMMFQPAVPKPRRSRVLLGVARDDRQHNNS
jgi:hypothetical protein